MVHEEGNDFKESWDGKELEHIEALLVATGPARI